VQNKLKAFRKGGRTRQRGEEGVGGGWLPGEFVYRTPWQFRGGPRVKKGRRAPMGLVRVRGGGGMCNGGQVAREWGDELGGWGGMEVDR